MLQTIGLGMAAGLAAVCAYYTYRAWGSRAIRIARYGRNCTCPNCGRVLVAGYPSFCFACGESLPNDYDPYTGLASQATVESPLGHSSLRIRVFQGREYGRDYYSVSLLTPEFDDPKKFPPFYVYTDPPSDSWDNLTFAEWMVSVVLGTVEDRAIDGFDAAAFTAFIETVQRAVQKLEGPGERHTVELTQSSRSLLTVFAASRMSFVPFDRSRYTISIRPDGAATPPCAVEIAAGSKTRAGAKSVADDVVQYFHLYQERQELSGVETEAQIQNLCEGMRAYSSTDALVYGVSLLRESLRAHQCISQYLELNAGNVRAGTARRGLEDLQFLAAVAEGAYDFGAARKATIGEQLVELKAAIDEATPAGGALTDPAATLIADARESLTRLQSYLSNPRSAFVRDLGARDIEPQERGAVPTSLHS